MLVLFLVCIVLISLAVAGLSIKMFLKKHGEFSRHCAAIEFENGEKVGCARCTAEGQKHEDCPSYELHHGTQVTQMAKAIKMIENEK
ncbi:MAG: hypothetical protein RRX93_03065 [Bacteroidales bacterium]